MDPRDSLDSSEWFFEAKSLLGCPENSKCEILVRIHIQALGSIASIHIDGKVVRDYKKWQGAGSPQEHSGYRNKMLHVIASTMDRSNELVCRKMLTTSLGHLLAPDAVF